MAGISSGACTPPAVADKRSSHAGTGHAPWIVEVADGVEASVRCPREYVCEGIGHEPVQADRDPESAQVRISDDPPVLEYFEFVHGSRRMFTLDQYAPTMVLLADRQNVVPHVAHRLERNLEARVQLHVHEPVPGRDSERTTFHGSPDCSWSRRNPASACSGEPRFGGVFVVSSACLDRVPLAVERMDYRRKSRPLRIGL